jgi:excisionase family DNA binding protein
MASDAPSHPHDSRLPPARARLCALIRQLSEGDVAILVRVAERLLPRPDVHGAAVAPAPPHAPAEQGTPPVGTPASHPATLSPARPTYTVAEAAPLLGLKETTLRERIRMGRLPVLRLDHRVLIRRETIERLLAEGVARPAADT